MDKTHNNFPDLDLFRRWQNGDSNARQRIWERLWEQKYPLGIYFCKPYLLSAAESDQRAHDLTTDALCETFRVLDTQLFSRKFKWKGTARFHSYFHTIYYRELAGRIKREISRFVVEPLPEESDAVLAHYDSDDKFELGALVCQYSCLSELLFRKGKRSSGEVAHAVALYVKCEIAKHTAAYAEFEWIDLPVNEIEKANVDALLADLHDGRETEIGRDASSQKFRDFLMKLLCGFELTNESRDRFCETLGLTFTGAADSGHRGRLTQEQLRAAFEEHKAGTKNDALIDEAYRGLSDFLRHRANIDQRWRRFKKDLDHVLPQVSNANQIKELKFYEDYIS